MLLFSSFPVSTIPSHLPRFGWCYNYLLRAPQSFASNPLPILRKKPKAFLCSASISAEHGNTEPDFTMLTAINSLYNDIVIVDTAESRMLLLDSTRMLNNIHSIFMKGQTWTGCYWDEFAALPAIIPKGPIAIFGLAGGTAAHLMLTLWPSLQLHGWEIDEILIDKAREHLGLSDLEKHTEGGGILHVHIGDALSTSSSVSGGYAGIVIDLFSGGEVLPQLQEVQTWLELNDKLMPNGRLMVNCGRRNDTIVNGSIGNENDNIWEKNSTLDVLCKAFPGQVNWKKMAKSEGDNYLALTGPLPDFTMWAAALPHRFSSTIKQWTSCFPS
ncbi:uncharacterized protein LOC112507297 isoform X1 [Cynara cardunculus var. scolymus]|uniref:uncharacterized protein LOC112507297 isoform X1 n=1 Tax=Cynara cardunculus var. scolymus TaxID=59895 RepID=UPI000D62EAD5|nr:uncharacterized protein LOC112507297 isoform X1 [Cynara cardunculus var. scolymus]